MAVKLARPGRSQALLRLSDDVEATLLGGGEDALRQPAGDGVRLDDAQRLVFVFFLFFFYRIGCVFYRRTWVEKKKKKFNNKRVGA